MSNIKGVPVTLGSFLVANLPDVAAHTGSWAFASDGRKAAEGGGSGTGNMCFSDGTIWVACDLGLEIVA